MSCTVSVGFFCLMHLRFLLDQKEEKKINKMCETKESEKAAKTTNRSVCDYGLQSNKTY